MIERTNGKLRKNMQMMTMKLNRYTLTFLTNIYLKLYIDPKASMRLYFIYRILIAVLFLYTFINNNPNFILELLYTFNNVYLNQLYEDSYINMNGNGKRSIEELFKVSENYNGPPGPKPNPDPFSGKMAMYEVENCSKRRRETLDETVKMGIPISHKPISDRHEFKNIPDLTVGKPMYANALTAGQLNQMSYEFSKTDKTKIYPESYHNKTPTYIVNNTIRQYIERRVMYNYHFSCPSNRFCEIIYPDNSKCFIYDGPALVSNLTYHHNYTKSPEYNYRCVFTKTAKIGSILTSSEWFDTVMKKK